MRVKSRKWREKVLKLCDSEPRMPLEVAKILKANVIAIRVEMNDLVQEGELKHKQVGRWHVFWRPPRQPES